MVDLKSLERRKSGFPILCQGQIPQIETTEQTHSPPNGFVTKVHSFSEKFQLPTKVSCCLRSESVLKSACSIIHFCILFARFLLFSSQMED